MRTKNKKTKDRTPNPKQKEEESAISKLENELKETQAGSQIVVNPVVSIISNPELYFAFMETAALDLFAKRKNIDALKIMTSLFTQYHEYKSRTNSDDSEISLIFQDSHNLKKEKGNGN